MELWKRNVYACLFGVMASSMGLSQVSPLLPIYFQELGVTGAAALSRWSGLAFGITFLAMAVTAPLWGMVADKKGRRLIMLIVSAAMAVTNFLLAYVSTPMEIVLCRLAVGLISGFYPAAITLLATNTPEDSRGWALSMLSAGSLAGVLIGPLFGGYIASTFGIRSTFYVVSILLVIAFLVALLFVREDKLAHTERPSVPLRKAWSGLPHHRLLQVILLSSFFYTLAASSLQPQMTIYISTLVPPGYPQLAMLSGFVFSLSGLAQMLAAPYLGKQIDKRGPMQIMIGSLTAVGFVILLQGMAPTVWYLAAFYFLMGLSLGGLTPSISTAIANHTPKEYTGQVFGYQQTFLCMGLFCAGFVGSSIVGAFGFPLLFRIAGGAMLLNAAYIYFHRDLFRKKLG